MTKYIEAESILDICRRYEEKVKAERAKGHFRYFGPDAMDYFFKRLREMVEVDRVVIPLRCHDCKHALGGCRGVTLPWCEHWRRPTDFGGYCHRAERRGE